LMELQLQVTPGRGRCVAVPRRTQLAGVAISS
jgi:hypothetical protein